LTELPIQAVFEQVLSCLASRNVPYMIMGGFAVRALGIPRPTYDADLTLDLPDAALQDLFQALEAERFVVPEEFREGFQDTLLGMRKVKVQKFLDRHVWDVDLFLVTTPYQRAAFDRRRLLRFLGQDRWTISPEDLILHKLLAHRRKDLVDVEEILKIQGGLDLAYLRDWAARLGISDRLSVMLREAGMGG
jgi:hypothetical protein